MQQRADESWIVQYNLFVLLSGDSLGFPNS